MKNLAILILAAGTSSRMGTPKQLLPFENETLLGTVIHNAIATKITSIYCVLGAHTEEVERRHKDLGIHFIHNPNYNQGMSTSIVAGVKRILKAQPRLNSLLILLGDQPFITEAHLHHYFRSHQSNDTKVVATQYPKGIGVPALFPRNTFPDLLQLKGDSGAKELLKTTEDKHVITHSPEILTDIDTQEAYRKALIKK